MKVTTWNINGVRAREADVHEWVRAERPDVLCLQETKASPHQIPASLVELDGYWAYWHGHKGYSGVALLVRRDVCPVRPEFSHPEFDVEHRIVVVSLGALRIASIYVPNGGKDFAAKMTFLEALERYAEAQHRAGLTLLLCGDYNVARTPIDVHPKLRNDAEIGQTAPERALFERLLSHGLTDLGRHFAPDDTELFTWWAPWRQYRERNVGWRLDCVLASAGAAKRALNCTARRDFGLSDHGPVTATFDGPLFDASQVTPGAEPPRVEPPPAAPDTEGQLDLFGNPVRSKR
ncbi:MAG: exodeoxyribonuclease III [Archangium sp.]|nr:exodeoxyribonuclease III [Archangium sp.]